MAIEATAILLRNIEKPEDVILGTLSWVRKALENHGRGPNTGDNIQVKRSMETNLDRFSRASLAMINQCEKEIISKP